MFYLNFPYFFVCHKKVAIVTELGGFCVCLLLRRGNEQDGCLPDSKSLLQKTLSGCHFSMPFPLHILLVQNENSLVFSETK